MGSVGLLLDEKPWDCPYPHVVPFSALPDESLDGRCTDCGNDVHLGES